jgi:UDP-glucose 4-epimerase
MISSTRTIEGKHVLVTGGAGFIGSHLIDALVAEGAGRVTIVDNLYLGTSANLIEARRKLPGLQILYIDASDTHAMREMLHDLGQVDVIFNLAAIPLPISLEQPQYCFDTNVRIAETLCELLREGGYTTLVHVSSSSVYGSVKTFPLDEEQPLRPQTPYAASKAASDALVLSYATTFGLDALIVRPFTIYGPRQYDRQYASVLPTLIHCALTDEVFSFFGDGEQTRDFLYVTDAVQAMLALYRCPETQGQIVNIGSGQEVHLKDLKLKLEILMKKAIACQYCESRPGDMRRQRADIKLCKSLTHFEPEMTLDEGLRRTIEFYSEQSEQMSYALSKS